MRGRLVLALVLLASPALALDEKQREAARALADAGRDLFDKGDYATAIQRFSEAESIVHAPPHLLYIARCDDKLGKLLAARDVYQRIAAEKLADRAPPVFVSAQDSAKKELVALQARIPKLTIVVSGADHAVVRLDGAPAEIGKPLPVDPGEHEVSASAPGETGPVKKSVVAPPDGQSIAVVIEILHPIADHPGPIERPRRAGRPPVGPVAVTGSGALVLVAGAALGGIAIHEMSELRAACPQDPCSPDNAPLKDKTLAFANASTSLVVIGAAALVGGGAWLGVEMARQDKTKAAAIVPWIGPAFAGLRGRF